MKQEVFHHILGAAAKAGASDVHLKVGIPPTFRIAGILKEVKAPQLRPEDTAAIAGYVLSYTNNPTPVEDVQEIDSSYSISGVGRFRVNVYRQRGTLAAIFRVIPFNVPTFEQLGVPKVAEKIAMSERGLVLVTGMTGSGKTSTLASMVNFINEARSCHILTIEDPIEYIHKDAKASISQREIGPDTSNFTLALRGALRQDPDIILLGEMRDLETVDIALKAAETGHLLLSTLHTTDASSTINRIIGMFPSHEQNAVRLRLADALVAIFSQRLIPRVGGRGRALALEVLVNTQTVKECIRNPDKTPEIRGHMEKGRDQYGMQSFDQHLSDLYRSGVIDLAIAKAASTNPSDFERALHVE